MSGLPIEQLTTPHREQLEALLDALASLPTAELIVRSVESMGVDPRNETDRGRIDAAMAGSWAIDRMLFYLDKTRTLNDHRMALGDEIRRLIDISEAESGASVEAGAAAQVQAVHLSGKQELVAHFMSISIQQVMSLLRVASDAVGYEIPQDDIDFLDGFRFLRNHFEHWYERLPGRINEAGLITKALTADEYRVMGGLETDDRDRIIVVEPKKPTPVTHVIDLTSGGIEKVEKIAQQTYEGITNTALSNVRAHFVADPQNIPPPESVRQELLIKVHGRKRS